ncbi:hypothetical protein LZ30DRAFT_723885 [Colletotrichum cereale]|nr:hypothetical protein LZ30DRAFT_723885 [Colletotrichum cereale]
MHHDRRVARTDSTSPRVSVPATEAAEQTVPWCQKPAHYYAIAYAILAQIVSGRPGRVRLSTLISLCRCAWQPPRASRSNVADTAGCHANCGTSVCAKGLPSPGQVHSAFSSCLRLGKVASWGRRRLLEGECAPERWQPSVSALIGLEGDIVCSVLCMRAPYGYIRLDEWRGCL